MGAAINFKKNKTLEINTMIDIFINNYQESWETRSSIRTRPRKYIDFRKCGYFFPEEKQPILLNQDIINLGEKIKEEILLQTFYKYLNDIVNLERNLINAACNSIIYGDLVISYPEEIKLDAYTIIIDEYYHVYLAKDMLIQLSRQFPNLENADYPLSDAYQAVELIKKQIDIKYHEVFEIIAVCIFETTLVRELVGFFSSENIHPSIRYYINDHMNDEAKHYGFFFDLLRYTWAHLPQDYKENIGSHFAHFIKLYLNINSEKIFNQRLLSHILKDEKKADLIIEDLYKGFDITPDIPIVKNVLTVLKKSSLDQDIYIKGSFKTIGWNL